MKNKTILLVLALAACSEPCLADPYPVATRDWQKSNAEELTITHRLVGLGCGPDRLTYTAEEEDMFPAPCYAIDTPENMCPTDPMFEDEPVLAWECAAYLGDGW